MWFKEITLFGIVLIVFVIISYLLKKAYSFLQNRSHMRIFNLEEYIPTEEIHSLKQLFYLVLMALVMIDIFYQITFYQFDLFYFAIFDLLLSLFIIILIKTNSIKDYILIFFLMPFGSVKFLLTDSYYLLFGLVDLVHIFVLLYMVWYLYNKFKKYTRTNGLGYTVLLLFFIILFSFIWTTIVEQVNPLDSLAMVSNAFTSNGYAVLGRTIAGKLNAIFLVWAGYVLSGVGTATLTIAIYSRYYNKRFDEIERLLKELNDKK